MKRLILTIFLGSVISLIGCIEPGEGQMPDQPLIEASGTLTQVAGIATPGECPNDGVILEHGFDGNGDGELSADEVIKTYTICHGKDGEDADESKITDLETQKMKIPGKYFFT